MWMKIWYLLFSVIWPSARVCSLHSSSTFSAASADVETERGKNLGQQEVRLITFSRSYFSSFHEPTSIMLSTSDEYADDGWNNSMLPHAICWNFETGRGLDTAMNRKPLKTRIDREFFDIFQLIYRFHFHFHCFDSVQCHSTLWNLNFLSFSVSSHLRKFSVDELSVDVVSCASIKK